MTEYHKDKSSAPTYLDQVLGLFCLDLHFIDRDERVLICEWRGEYETRKTGIIKGCGEIFEPARENLSEYQIFHCEDLPSLTKTLLTNNTQQLLPPQIHRSVSSWFFWWLSVRMVKKPKLPQILTGSFTHSVPRSPIELSLNMIMIMLCHFKDMTGHIWNSYVW